MNIHIVWKKTFSGEIFLFVCYCWDCGDVEWMNFVASTGAMTLHLFACLLARQYTQTTQEREWTAHTHAKNEIKKCGDKYTQPIYLLKRVCYIVFVTSAAINAHILSMCARVYYCVCFFVLFPLKLTKLLFFFCSVSEQCSNAYTKLIEVKILSGHVGARFDEFYDLFIL